MNLDIVPQEGFSITRGYGCIPQEYQPNGIYSCCPCAAKPTPPEPTTEVLEEIQHKKDIQSIKRSTQKLVYELQHAKMKLALMKLDKEIEQIQSIAPLKQEPEKEVVETSS